MRRQKVIKCFLSFSFWPEDYNVSKVCLWTIRGENMTARREFIGKVQSLLNDIDEDVLSYDESEFWMVESVYDQIEFYANANQLLNTAIALPLARGLHNGTHRKSKMMKNGLAYNMPYLIHPMLVCRMLMDLRVPMEHDEEDILLAAALCHDMIEDVPFTDGGHEMYKKYHLDKRVYDAVKLVSKRRDFSEAEEREFFRKIRADKFALLIKLSDRGHNVEDLYNMSVWKVHEYVAETKRYFLPMCQHGVVNFPELYHTIEILLDKMVLLTESAETLVDRYEAEEKKLLLQEKKLREANIRLRNLRDAYLENGQAIPDLAMNYKPAEPIDDQLEEAAFNEEQEEFVCGTLASAIIMHCMEKGLMHTMNALDLLQDSLIVSSADENKEDAYADYKHCLLAVKSLIDLHPVLSADDEDVVLASVLCHVLFELLPFDDYPNVFHLNEDVFRTTKLAARQKVLHVHEKAPLYAAVLEDHNAVLAKLADQSVHVQQLYRESIFEAQEWIRETRTFVMPLCIAAREKYPELYPVISILMEKMKALMEVSATLASRYMEREETLTKEVLNLMEENARLYQLGLAAERKY